MTVTRRIYVPGIGWGILALSCSSGDDAASPGGNDGGGGAAAVPPLEFSTCPLRITQPLTAPPTGPLSADGFDGGYSALGEWLAVSSGLADMSSAMAECATARMPAVWDEPEGDSIEVFVKRYPAAEQPSTGQVWLLEGGPGLPSSTMEHMAYFMGAANPTLDVYLPDHRGTGNSAFRECPPVSTPAECAATVPHIEGLTVTGAARDLAALIDASDPGSRQVFVYGVSYGTYWAQRYLQLRPDQPTAVILDSVLPVGADFADFDGQLDRKAREVMALCQADATCSTKLGSDPLAAAEQLVAATDLECVQRLPASPRLYFGQLVGGDYFDRLLLPASIYRVLRCTAADKEWLGKVAAYRAWMSRPFSIGNSPVVFNNIILSELWNTDATPAQLWAAGAMMIAADGAPAGMANTALHWPRYPRDSYYGEWPSSPAPILVLQGGMDARTPFGDIVQAEYSGEQQHYVEMPLATHALLRPVTSPMADLTAPGCGWQVIQSFLADPSRAPDTSCIAGMMPIDWGNPPPEWMALVGIDDLWENP